MSWNEIGLTGRQRFRVGMFGKMILQVEAVTKFNAQPCPYTCDMPPWHGDERTKWRDAKLEDITNEQRNLKCSCKSDNVKLPSLAKAQLLQE